LSLAIDEQHVAIIDKRGLRRVDADAPNGNQSIQSIQSISQ